MRIFAPVNTTAYCGKIDDYFDFNTIVLMMPPNVK